MAAARDVGVCRGDQPRAGITREIVQEVLERNLGRRAHAASRRGVQRVGTDVLYGHEAQRVDRGFTNDSAGQGIGTSRQAKERLGAARREFSEVETAHLDTGQTTRRVAMREPGAAAGAIPHRVRGPCRQEDGLRQATLTGQIAPGLRSQR